MCVNFNMSGNDECKLACFARGEFFPWAILEYFISVMHQCGHTQTHTDPCTQEKATISISSLVMGE